MNFKKNGVWIRLHLDAPSNILCEIIIHNTSIDKYCKVGVRNIGSTNKEFLLGPKEFASRAVNSKNDSTIEAYFEEKSNVKYFLLRSFKPNLATFSIT
jgi:hypothetical protein